MRAAKALLAAEGSKTVAAAESALHRLAVQGCGDEAQRRPFTEALEAGRVEDAVLIARGHERLAGRRGRVAAAARWRARVREAEQAAGEP